MVCGAMGAQAKVALLKNATEWGGSPVSNPSSNDRIPFSAEGFGHEDDYFESKQITGSVWRGRPIRVADRIAGELSAEGDYDYILRPLALAMGQNTLTVVESGVAYQHRLDLDDDLCGIYGTIGVDRVADHLASPSPSSAYVYPFAKANGFAIRYAAGEPLTLAVPFLVNDEDVEQDSTAWTYESDDPAFMPKPILFSHAVLRVLERDDTGAMSTSPTYLRPVSFGLVCERKLVGRTDQDTTISEPSFTDFPQVDLSMEFGELATDLWQAFVASKRAETALKMDLIFTGGVLGGQNYLFKIELPSVYVMRAEPQVREAGVIPLPVEARCEPSDGTVAGMSGITAPCRITIINGIGVDPLA